MIDTQLEQALNIARKAVTIAADELKSYYGNVSPTGYGANNAYWIARFVETLAIERPSDEHK